jgi:prophage antirepressor-like protein
MRSIKQGGESMRIETWNGHVIRFVERNSEWWAVLADVAEALDLDTFHIRERLTPEFVEVCRVKSIKICGIVSTDSTYKVNSLSVNTCENDLLSNGSKQMRGKPTRERKNQDMLVVNEFGLYEAILESRKPEAKAFKLWVFEVIKTIRQDVLKLKEYETFRLMDREHQKEAMRKLSDSLRTPVKVDYIKANLIADKTVSTIHGLSKLVKKSDMDEQMLHEREPILADTVELMTVNEWLNLGLSVSEVIYRTHSAPSKKDSIERQGD